MYLNFYQKLTILFAWALFIVVLILSPMPLSSAQEATTYFDKIVHAFLFGILAFLIVYLFHNREETARLNPERVDPKSEHKKNKLLVANTPLNIFLLSFFISSGFSLLLEYAQNFVPGRSVDDFDSLASVIGIILVLVFIYGDSYSKK